MQRSSLEGRIAGMPIDLRSDTVTTPTPELRQAMLTAPVGDDVYGEDPTVNLLQDKVAAMLGFESALFVPSGVMANQVAIAAHVQRGEEVICAAGAHIYEYELGMMAAFSGVVPRFVPAPLDWPSRRWAQTRPPRSRASPRRALATR